MMGQQNLENNGARNLRNLSVHDHHSPRLNDMMGQQNLENNGARNLRNLSVHDRHSPRLNDHSIIPF